MPHFTFPKNVFDATRTDFRMVWVGSHGCSLMPTSNTLRIVRFYDLNDQIAVFRFVISLLSRVKRLDCGTRRDGQKLDFVTQSSQSVIGFIGAENRNIGGQGRSDNTIIALCFNLTVNLFTNRNNLGPEVGVYRIFGKNTHLASLHTTR